MSQPDRQCTAINPSADFCAMCDVRETSICAEFSAPEMAQVSKLMAHRKVEAGHAILSEGEPNENLYVVVKGSFRLTKYLEDGRRQVTGFLFKGDFVGVRSCGENAYSAEALEDSLVCRFPHRYLDDVAISAPGIKDRLIARGQTEYHKAQEHIVLLGKKTAEERVIAFLKMTHSAEKNAAGQPVKLSMSRQDIADYLGLRIETLSRTFASLKKAGKVTEVSRREILLNGAV